MVEEAKVNVLVVPLFQQIPETEVCDFLSFVGDIG